MGVGKTHYMATAPGLYVIDADHGDNAKMREIDAPYLVLDDQEPYRKLLGFLTDVLMRRDVFDPDGGPHADTQTIGLDSWTKINELLLFDICKKANVDLSDEKPSWDHYMKLKNRQIIIVKLLDDISIKRGLNVIVTALPMLVGDDEEKMTRDAKDAGSGYKSLDGMPNLVGAYKKLIGAAFDEVYYIEKKVALGAGGQVARRTFYTDTYGVWQAKTRRVLPYSLVNPSFATFAEQDRGEKPAVAKAA
jgi:hypothetical protein